jgi:hypothetical protein
MADIITQSKKNLLYLIKRNPSFLKYLRNGNPVPVLYIPIVGGGAVFAERGDGGTVDLKIVSSLVGERKIATDILSL